jgi:hypothetical protein
VNCFLFLVKTTFKSPSVGCPIAYVPLSLHTPACIKDLQAIQAQFSKEQAWFLPEQQPSDVVLLGPTGAEEAVDLQQELSEAIDAPMELDSTSPTISNTHLPRNHCQGQSVVKTSETHPIKYVPPVTLGQSLNSLVILVFP